ncbi:MAG: hypothetical protein KC609_06905 [Myxococcales bacterium]|nr:hypothetical protein [Myxococcales bacterium]
MYDDKRLNQVENPEERLTRQVCSNLRAKEFYLDGPSVAEMSHSGPETAYWCLQTMQPFGPDDQYCCPEECQRGRACHEEL